MGDGVRGGGAASYNDYGNGGKDKGIVILVMIGRVMSWKWNGVGGYCSDGMLVSLW